MSGTYNGLIAENCAPQGVTKIGFYRNGQKDYELHLPPQMIAPSGTKLYTFGAASDVHTYANSSYANDTTANADFARAVSWYKDNADFLVICGDLTCYGNAADLANYKTLADANRGSMPIYAMAGNHESWSGTVTSANMETYTGHPLYYSFTQGNDVFIMCGCSSQNTAFTQAELQWLYETLEANRNKRCFLFQHGMILGYSGDPTKIYPFDILSGTFGQVFQSLLRHYTNTIYFHGHSHILYESQTFTQSEGIPNCIIDTHLGIYSVHIPSLAIPINITSGSRVVEANRSQGYIVDVYTNEILLRGRDFTAADGTPHDKYISTGIYKLDTTLKTVEAGTYTDSTGTITT